MNKLYLSEPAVLSCAGNTLNKLYSACINGKQDGIVQVKALNNKTYLSGRIQSVPELPNADYGIEKTRSIRSAKHAADSIQHIIKEAARFYGAQNIALCIGTCDNGSCISPAAHIEFFKTGKFPPRYNILTQGAALIPQYIAKLFGISGPVFAVSTACSGGAGAIIRAAELVQSGVCKTAIAGGIDVNADIVLIGFDSLEALSPDICDPFSKNRRGITLGEAAVFFLVSRDDISQNGIVLKGWGESSDAYHVTAPAPDGSGAADAMKAALQNAHIDGNDIDYINLHGTGTKLNDSAEALALQSAFNVIPPASSTKPVTGHTLGAAGALELAICYAALSCGEKLLPPHIFDGQYDSTLPPIPLVQKNESTKHINFCMSNSFAFGGCNVSLIIGRDL